MKKYFLSFVIVFFLLVAQSSSAFAANISNETFTWSGQSIRVTGSDLQSAATLNIPGNTNFSLFPGTLTIKTSSGSCVVIINDMKISSDEKSATLTASNSIGLSPSKNACPATIISAFNNKTVSLKGTPPKSPQGLKKVTITVLESGSNMPGSVKFTIGNQSQTAQKEAVTGGVSYQVIFYLDPKNYQVCAKPTVPGLSCDSFTKEPNVPLQLTYGQIVLTVPTNVGNIPNLKNLNENKGSIYVDILTPTSCNTNPLYIALNQGASTIQTVRATLDPVLPGDKKVMNEYSVEFPNVPPGNYTVCIPSNGKDCSQSQDVTKVSGKAGNVTFNDLGNTPGVGIGGGGGVAICPDGNGSSQVPPPSPPCNHWSSKGVCDSFLTVFGTFPTTPAFLTRIFAIMLSLSGGIAVLLILRAGYTMLTSRGKPEQIKEGRDQLIAAVVGLVFLIFAFVFLQLIGFDILRIPGFQQ